MGLDLSSAGLDHLFAQHDRGRVGARDIRQLHFDDCVRGQCDALQVGDRAGHAR